MSLRLSFFLVFVEFSWDNLDELCLVDSKFFLDVILFFLVFILFFDRLAVGSVDKLFYLLLGEVLFEIFYYLGQWFFGNHFPFLAFIHEQFIGLLDVLVAVLLAHLYDHDFQKLLEVDFGLIKLSVFFACTEVTDEIADLFVTGIESECSEDNFKVFGLDGAWAWDVEEVKCFFDFIFLWSCEHLLVVQYFFAVVLRRLSWRRLWYDCVFGFGCHL